MGGVILATWAPRGCQILVKVIDAHAALADSDDFGGVVLAMLGIQSRLRKGGIRRALLSWNKGRSR